MNIGLASDAQAVLAVLDARVDPFTLSAATREAAFRLAQESHDALFAGLDRRTLWADHQPMEDSAVTE